MPRTRESEIKALESTAATRTKQGAKKWARFKNEDSWPDYHKSQTDYATAEKALLAAKKKREEPD